MDTVPFTIRLQKIDYDALVVLANLEGVPTAALARGFILDKVTQSLDPEEITKRLDAKKEFMIARSAEIKARRNSAQ
jgi:hypothetical protein